MYFLVFKVDNLCFKLKVLFFERMQVKPGCYLSLLFIYGDLLSIHSGMAIKIEGCKIFMNLENIVLTSLSIRIVGLEQPSVFMTSVIDLFFIKKAVNCLKEEV